jgi:hypothetical protein
LARGSLRFPGADLVVVAGAELFTASCVLVSRDLTVGPGRIRRLRGA